ncbi:hypothetical protein [Xanthomonas arboricola]
MAQLLQACGTRVSPPPTAQSIAAIAPFFVAACGPMSCADAPRCTRIGASCQVHASPSASPLKADALRSPRRFAQRFHAVSALRGNEMRQCHCSAIVAVARW